MQETTMKKCTTEIFGRKLPPSSFEVIKLPTIGTTNKKLIKVPFEVTPTPTTKKRPHHEEEGAKRQKVMKPLFDQAEEFRAKLDATYPSFTKVLKHSHVGGSFWMGLPSQFCKHHLPKKDTNFVLEYENGKQYSTKYLAASTALSGGWKGSALAEKLLQGDVLVFRLVNPTKFKLYRIRESEMTDIRMTDSQHQQHLGPQSDQNGVNGAVELNATKEMGTQVPSSPRTSSPKPEHEEVLSEDDNRITQQTKNAERNSPAKDMGTHLPFSPRTSSPNLEHEEVFSEDWSTGFMQLIEMAERNSPAKDMGTHLPSSPRTSCPNPDHEKILSAVDNGIPQQMKNAERNSPANNLESSKFFQSPCDAGVDSGFPSFEDFLISIEELLKKDYELPDHIKSSYYQLCSSQNALLHINLSKGIGPIFVAGSIIEIVNVANEIKNCELHTCDSKFSTWDQMLKCLEVLGMNVGFLCAHLDRIRRLAHDPEAVKNRQKYLDLCSQHAESEIMIKNLQDRLSELMKASEKRADDIEKLKTEMMKHELRFQEQVSAPW